MLENPIQRTIQLLPTDGKLKSTVGRLLEYPKFFFGDSIHLDDRFMSIKEERWLHEVDREELFHLPTARSYSLAHLQQFFALKHLEWEMTPSSQGESVSQISDVKASTSQGAKVLGLFLGHIQDRYLKGETLRLAT